MGTKVTIYTPILTGQGKIFFIVIPHVKVYWKVKFRQDDNNGEFMSCITVVELR